MAVFLVFDGFLVLVPIALSIYHYFISKELLGERVATNFDVNGAPNFDGPASLFVLYPALSCGIAIVSLVFALFMEPYFGIFFSINIAAALIVLLVAQWYSVPISRKELTRIPPRAFYTSLGFLLVSTIFLIVYSLVWFQGYI